MGHGGDVIAELTTDHREVEELFARIEALPPGDARRRELTDAAVRELVRHSVAEEMYLYPAVRSALPDGDRVADKEIADHSGAERTMKDLESLDAGVPEFDRLVRELIAEVRAHIRDEEDTLFPRLRESTTPDDLAKLGEQVRRAKSIAPTRPHPSSPSTPPANKLLAPGAGMVDRLRDALTGRGKD
ncbi:hemerythrin domain-containing protein [Streptomyces roseirectus]|uniref:Hemerythrin domain-containing protein n=1 Tax=Streptomyces roseirectus TaxID=2768066 RepID=A0A7H0INM5_9ACTN|nr:hemerythrin domain-containing protein [Streptomyces roseirectus]QNP74391.1 hemerythrin domain-containing protein [Streptomyces roseirectus]